MSDYPSSYIGKKVPGTQDCAGGLSQTNKLNIINPDKPVYLRPASRGNLTWL